MVLQNFEINNGLVNARWTTTFDTPWFNIIKGVKALLPYYSSYNVIVGNVGETPQQVDISQPTIPEKSALVLTGQSSLFNGPLKMTFTNNGSYVDLLFTTNLGFALEYEAISKAFGQYMDACEIMMCR